MTPMEYWQALEGGTTMAAGCGGMLPLVQLMGGQFEVALQQEMARHGWAPFVDGRSVSHPGSSSGFLARWAAGNGVPVCTYLLRPSIDCPEQVPETAWCHDSTGKRVLDDTGRPVMKPTLSPGDVAALAALSMPPLAAILATGARIGVIVDAGEDGTPVPDRGGPYWRQDPTVARALEKQLPGDLVNFYGSAKGAQLRARTLAAQRIVGDAVPIIPYVSANATQGWYNERQQVGTCWQDRHLRWWGTHASGELYYKASGNGIYTSEPRNLARCATNLAAQAMGRPQCHYVNGGQSLTDPTRNAPIRLYRGFLRWTFILGCLGWIHGYCTTPAGGFNRDFGTEPPNWLLQQVTMAEERAFLTKYLPFLTDGTLLDGDGDHAWQANGAHPSYECFTGDPTAHVAARRHRDGRVLVCAWSADGVSHQVTVTIAGQTRTMWTHGDGNLVEW